MEHFGAPLLFTEYYLNVLVLYNHVVGVWQRMQIELRERNFQHSGV
jgi:hypothetical protein